MPDHFHLQLTVDRYMTIEHAVQFVKGGFALRDWEAFQRARDYIRNNPVARHLVGKAEDFPYSSAHAGFELDPAPLGLKPVEMVAGYGTAKAVP